MTSLPVLIQFGGKHLKDMFGMLFRFLFHAINVLWFQYCQSTAWFIHVSHVLNIVLNNLVPIPHPSQNNVYLFNVVVSVLFEKILFLPYKQ